MAKSSRQKQKLLYILKMLMEQTDENHGLTVAQIIEQLSDMGIPAERKSVYDDLEVLEQFGRDCGYEIIRNKTNTTVYYIGRRQFQLVELKLLVDSIQSSKFITLKKSHELISKVESLASVHEGKQLQRQVYVSNRVKNPTETIYYAVNSIHEAISQDKKITFFYTEWAMGGAGEKIYKRRRRDGNRYSVSPWALTWDDENYYLVAFDDEAQAIRHYRVDKMERVEISDAARDGRDVFDKFDMALYSKSVFGMFGGELTTVKLRFHKSMIGVVADRFGKNACVVEDGDEHFTLDVNVALSPQFFGWLFGLSDKVQIIAPDTAVGMYKEELERIVQMYNR
ncbi:MAG: WYL domain-containing protein [Clostridia bacterium]|nr:WYL domain-containing protein [Clostridia bacterium]